MTGRSRWRWTLVATLLTLGTGAVSLADSPAKDAYAEFERHQAAVRALEDQGFALYYEHGEDASAEVRVPGSNASSAYVRNALARRVVVPVVAVSSHGAHGLAWAVALDGGFDFSQLEQFPQLRELHLPHVSTSINDLRQLRSLPELKLLVLPEKLLTDEVRAELLELMPYCEIESDSVFYSICNGR